VIAKCAGWELSEQPLVVFKAIYGHFSAKTKVPLMTPMASKDLHGMNWAKSKNRIRNRGPTRSTRLSLRDMGLDLNGSKLWMRAD
jgi:hypothetical protein